jgi:hypothetical protein
MAVKKPKPLRKFSHDELKKAVEHLAFETQHFRCYRKLHHNGKLRAFSAAATQAVGYSLLLHLRVLIDFFYAAPEKDDCCVDHLNALPGFATSFPASLHVHTPKTREVSETLNKFLAHLTATRWEKPRQAWDYYDQFAPTIENLVEKFETALPDDFKKVYLKAYQHWDSNHHGTV